MNDIQNAAERIKPLAHLTPVIRSEALDALCGGRVFIKAETLQRTGSFKFRGAANFLLAQHKTDLAHGVVAVSSGNHGQAVALAASLLGVKSTVFMPHDAPGLKIAGARAYGATVILYNRFNEDREMLVQQFIERTGANYVRPFNDPLIMAGQGTAGLELVTQLGEQDVLADAIAVPCGGGGLSSGVIAAMRSAFPKVEPFIVEPEEFDDTGRSLAGGERVSNSPSARSICDALQTPVPGALTFPILKDCAAVGLKVSDDEVKASMRWAFEKLKLVVEPGGAVALAALLFKKLDARGRTVALILSGANVDAEFFADILQTGCLDIPA
ncbi:MAG: threonine/serine dehydratase [Rhizobiaceae bacterium]